MIQYYEPILIKQSFIGRDKQTTSINGVGKLTHNEEHNVYFIDLLDEENIPFNTYYYNNGSFKALIEVEYKGRLEKFELQILPDLEMFQFEVIENKNFSLFKKLIETVNLEKELSKKEIKRGLNKI